MIICGWKQGREITTSNSGKLWREYNYINNLLYGLARGWWDNGQMEFEENYINDKLNGHVRVWYLDGKLMYDTIYQDHIEI